MLPYEISKEMWIAVVQLNHQSWPQYNDVCHLRFLPSHHELFASLSCWDSHSVTTDHGGMCIHVSLCTAEMSVAL